MIDKINVNNVVNIAKQAGMAILKIYEQDFSVEYKYDRSPLTSADIESNKIIKEGLKDLYDGIPILSEEGSIPPYQERKDWIFFWLIDPLDGTKEFMKKNGEFTVNISLIYKNSPVLGVVYAPALNHCYWAKLGEGAFKNGKKLPFDNSDDNDIYRVVCSRSHMSDKTKQFINRLSKRRRIKVISVGSSLKICLIAEGGADIYPRMSPTMEWDTAAAHVILKESGKDIKCCLGSCRDNLTYNKESLVNCSFVAQ